MIEILPARRRQGVRRHVRSACRAMSWAGFEVVGETLHDLSPHGALLECDGPAADGEVRIGDEVLLAFRMPWLGPDVVVTAEVARVIEGRRAGDPGRCVGLRFVDLDPEEREELRARLAMLEPTAPARQHPIDYALAVRSVEHHAAGDAILL